MYRRYLIKRVLNAILNYLIIIFLLSLMFNTTAEKTVRIQVQEQVQAEVARLRNFTSEQVQQWRADREAFLIHKFHLDQPFLSRVFWKTVDTITFRFGNSTIIKSSQGERDVWTIILETMPRTAILFSTAIVIEIVVAIWLGLKKAQRPGGLLDRSTSVGTMIVYGMPSWWVGMLLLMLFVYIVPIFPSGGMTSIPPRHGFLGFLDLLYHMTLPLITLVVIGFWGTALLTRNIVLGILQDDYIMAARARGLPERRVLFGHTLRTAAPPIITIALLSLLGSVFGSIILEGIFSWPGMGNLYWIAVQQNDVPVILGLLSVTTGLYMAGLVMLDLIYGFLDPRIKVGGKG